MTKGKGKKPSFVVDAHFVVDRFNKHLSKYARFYSVTDFCGHSNPEDKEIFNKSTSKGYHIITQNFKDFRALSKSKPQNKIGIIKIPDTRPSTVLPQVKNMLEKYPYDHNYRKKMISLSEEGVQFLSGSTERV